MIASGSVAAACASASTKVSGVGAAGVVGVTGSSIADATCASLAVGGRLVDVADLQGVADVLLQRGHDVAGGETGRGVLDLVKALS